MKKSGRLLFFLVLVMALVTGACGSSTSQQNSVSLSETSGSSSTAGPSVSKEEETGPVTAESAVLAYAEYFGEIFDGEDISTIRYTLAYINDDDIPELLYMEGNFHAAGVHVLICDDHGNVCDIGEFGEYGNFAYKERAGKILSYTMNNGVYFVDFYDLDGLSLVDDTYFEYDEAQNSKDTERYYVDGDEVDAETYHEEYTGKGIDAYTYVYYDYALSLADTDSLGRVFSGFLEDGRQPSVVDLASFSEDITGDWTLDLAMTDGQTEYDQAEDLGMAAAFHVSEDGSFLFTMEYEEKTVEDRDMTANALEQVLGQRALAFSNDARNRHFTVTLSGGQMLVTISDHSKTFDTENVKMVFVKDGDTLEEQ